MAIPIGSSFHGYTVLGVIGHGGFSTIYRVRSEKFGLEFAAKVTNCEPSTAEASHHVYQAEIDALRSLEHPNIVLLYDYFFDNESEYEILELCKNGCLADEVNASHRKGLSLDRFTSVASQLLSALEYCHGKGIAHRDIKPANILIDEYGRPKLADFGVARVREGNDDDGEAGTWAFLAPEVLLKQAGDRSKADVWALAVTFAFMLDAFLPWPSVPGRMYDAIVHGQYVVSRQIPGLLADLLRRMFVVKPDQRATAEQLRKHPFFGGQAEKTGGFVGLRVGKKSRKMSTLESFPRLPAHDSVPSQKISVARSTPMNLTLAGLDGSWLAQSEET
jgi:serine/threonine protein kinase